MNTGLRHLKWAQLMIAIIAIGLIWLVALPAIGRQPIVDEHVAHQKRLGIDPSAMFYTELEISPMIARHVEQLNEAHSASFWRLSPSKDGVSTDGVSR